MTEEKKSKNPFVNMANEAKKKNNIPNAKQFENKMPKVNTKGFGGSSVVRRTGRGG
jgi:hypothetical protein